jgi:hypothetical protein
MADDGPGDWGQPQFDDSSAPDVAVNPTLVANYFATLAARRFTTVALLLAATPPGNGYVARADNAPGAWWVYNSGWRMYGVPRLASSTAALTAPALGDRCVLTSTEITYRYNGAAWKEWESDWSTPAARVPVNVTLGSGGTCLGKFRYEQGRIHDHVEIILGTGGVLTGIPAFPLPVTARALKFSAELYSVDGGMLWDASPGTVYGVMIGAVASSTTQARFLMIGTNGVIGAIAAGSPFTWAINDQAIADYFYDPA